MVRDDASLQRYELEEAYTPTERDILIMQAEDAASDPDFCGSEFDAMFWGPAQEAAYYEYEEFIDDCVRQAQQAEEDELDLPDDEYLERGRYGPSLQGTAAWCLA